jgi:hypothetical protein
MAKANNKNTSIAKSKNPLTLYEKMGLSQNASALTTEQILHIMQKTPKNHIYSRPAKGGGTWDYVTGAYVEKVLNYLFAWDWDFEIKSKEEKYGQVIVTGRLTIRTSNGKTIIKEQIGRADIQMKKNTTIPLDYGNTEKAAATDSFKKCASKLGIASDVYAKDEFREIEMVKQDNGIKDFKDEKKAGTDTNVQTKPAEEKSATEINVGIKSEVQEAEVVDEKPQSTPAKEAKKEPEKKVKPISGGQKIILKNWIAAKKIKMTEKEMETLSYDDAHAIISKTR